MALEAPDRGEFATVAFMPPGRKLLINAVTKRAGSITVEVAALGGAPIPGHTFADADPTIGDQYRTPVTWQGEADLGLGEASAIMLRFRLDKAAIFGLDFED